MEFKIVILWTDGLLFLLLFALAGAVFFISQSEQLCRPWQQIVRSKRGLSGLFILGCYAMVALLDSLHFQAVLPVQEAAGATHYETQIRSVLDELLLPLGTVTEKTYSAPLALYAYSKHTLQLPSGEVVREYPRLRYAGKHLPDEHLHKRVLWQLALTGMLQGLLLSTALLAVLVFFMMVSYRLRQQADSLAFFACREKRQMLMTVALILFLVCQFLCVCYALSSDYHVFGTDKIGQDVFYQAIKSIRTGLIIGSVTTVVMLPFALFFGAVAGFFGGVLDDLIQYLYTTLSSIPGVLLISAAVLMLQVFMAKHPEFFNSVAKRVDARLLALCCILGLSSWTTLCRLIRAETLKLRAMDYVQAATVMGVAPLRIIGRHILPNVMHLVFIVIALDFSGLVLAEAVLSYVGVGVDPASYSWGNMINQARLELAREPVVWWSLVASFSLMFVLVLFANLFADAVREAFDPRIESV